MRKSGKFISGFLFASAGVTAPGAIAQITGAAGQIITGQYTLTNGPLTNNLITSVDINGNNGPSSNAPTEGWNGSTSPPDTTGSPDSYGVTWTPWGGPVTPGGGDGTAWPSSDGTAVGTASAVGTYEANEGSDSNTGVSLINDVNWFQKSFNGATVTVSAPGANPNETNGPYGGYSASSYPINSRDRGLAAPSAYTGAGSGQAAPNNTASYDGNMFEDFIFAPANSDAIQGTNYIQFQVSGLTPGATYQLALYSGDNGAARATNWTATAPVVSANGAWGWWSAASLTNANTLNFAPPSDEQTIDWEGTTGFNGADPNNNPSLPGYAGPYNGFDENDPPRLPAVFNLVANGNGSITVWGFGGDGAVDQTAQSTYLDGFQIASVAVPEPATIGLLGAAAVGLMARRRTRKA